MGVLVHPSYRDELVNGVAVSFDPFDDGSSRAYYVNSQVGEDLITNPEAHSTPEEVLLFEHSNPRVRSLSNQVPAGQLLMSREQMDQLYDHLADVHYRFRRLYEPAAGEPFAMEIEFKITSEDVLAIKQARPWVFGPEEMPDFTGTVELSSAWPLVRRPLTAVVKDDNIALGSIDWSWERSPDGTSSWTTISNADSATYEPTADDDGNYLRGDGVLHRRSRSRQGRLSGHGKCGRAS